MPWLAGDTAMVNHFYFYGFDSDFGPFFIKFATYFPYTAKVCINGHELANRQAAKAGIAVRDAGQRCSLSCDDPASRAADLRLLVARHMIDAFVRKWLARLPHPFTSADRRAGYRYDLSVLQAEFSLAHIDHLDASIDSLSGEIGRRCDPFGDLIERMCEVPGVSRVVAETVIAETGADMTRFATPQQLCAWARSCQPATNQPRQRRPAGTRKG